MPRTTTFSGRNPIVVDPSSLERTTGRVPDWANITTTTADGRKVLYAGTPVGELLGGGKVSPRVVTTNPAVGIWETTVIQTDSGAAISGGSMLKGGVLYENMLPTATGTPATLPAAVKTELTNAGCSFKFENYADTRS